jgi:hypothetical protein
MYSNFDSYECDECGETFAFHEDFLNHLADEEL